MTNTPQPTSEEQRARDALARLRAKSMMNCENELVKVADIRSILAQAAQVDTLTRERDEAVERATRAEGERDDVKTAIHDLVMLKAQDDIGCVPPPTREQWRKAWAEAEELVRVES